MRALDIGVSVKKKSLKIGLYMKKALKWWQNGQKGPKMTPF
jgi:hypothetical protein